MFKKITKIIFSLILILGLMFTVSACGKSDDDPDDNSTNQDVEYWK